ncbi:hypothetical protein EYS42_16415 [Aquabacterium lacunae]|uniref:Toxin VasX N-terminal region domain-containing protein n=1 Tax=Aquabacterium lacunae TaxID=2528630 RepID=A0A4Q9GUK3_9BURK|nr:T6SS effector BTH_I2691 family protein [Aquabacterium lacunae]TBO27689.1 hypothetical protein EYS42_16415 [Aquabacterium lacunae]
MTSLHPDCKHCQKSSLSLLLLRPSPLANDAKLRPAGADKVAADTALVSPFVPAGLQQSRPVLRLLRAGYVHLYVPTRDTGQVPSKAWHTWRVTDEGDLLAQSHPLFTTPSASAVCSRSGHNASGFKLIQIPDAHELMGQSVWLAFSANLWSAKLKRQNKANPQAMVEIKLGEAKAPAFKPDEASLRSQVLECSALKYAAPAFPFNSLAGGDGTKHMAETLHKAASHHAKTKGRELAVVLPDPVGYAAELNALRLTADRLGLQLSPTDQHKLQSHFTLEGLSNNVADLRAVNNVAPVLSKASFESLQKSSPLRMQDAAWVPLNDNERPSPQQMGRMWTPKAREQLRLQTPAFKARAKAEIEKGYDPQASVKWVQALEEKTRKALEPYERQWLAGRDHAAVARYFVQHFDDEDRNRPGTAQDHSPGATYLREVALIDGPPPKTSVPLLDAYMAAYLKAPDDPQAFLVRAMAANQKDLLGALGTQLAGDPNGDGMRDKSVDFIKGLLDVTGERFKVKYSWLADATIGFAMGPMNNLAAAAGSYVALEGADALAKHPKVAALATNAAAWFGGMDTALKTAMTQKVVRPVLASFWVDQGLVNRAIAGANGEAQGWQGARPGGRQRVTVLTDTERLRKGPVDVQALLAGGDGVEVAHGRQAGTALAAKASAAGGATGLIVLNAATGLTPQQGAALFAQQVEEARKIGGSIRAAIPQGTKAMAMSIDGRLALASVIVQTIGIINGTQAVAAAEANLAKASDAADRADKEKKLRDARLGYMDSIGGLVAGSLDSLRAAGETMNLQRGAAAGNVAINSIHALKFGAQVAGVFGGFLNGYVSYLKAEDAKEKGLRSVFVLHRVAMVMFGGTALAAGSPIAAGTLSYLAARSVGGRVVQGAATRMAAATVAGAWIPVAGWVLLGVGIVTSVSAALLEPTQVEAWARQTPFGKGPEGQKFMTLKEQDKALYEALGLASESTTKEAQAA